MALWQYDAVLVPKSEVIKLGLTPPMAVLPILVDTVDWWRTIQPPISYHHLIGQVLPSRTSWSEDILAWGREDGDSLEIVMDGGRVTEMIARVDVRGLGTDMLRLVVNLAVECGCWLLGPRHNLMRSDYEELVEDIRNSNAARFVSNPDRFLRAIRTEDQSDVFLS